MKKLPSRFRTTMRPMIYSLSSAFALLATGTASANFADTPIYLQNETKIQGGAGKVKPNVMLFIDDSGSMNWTVTGSQLSRLQITKNALSAVVKKYTNQINWGFQTLHNNGSANLPGYTDDSTRVLQSIDNLAAKGGTPTTYRYYQIAQDVIDNTRYRCQKKLYRFNVGWRCQRQPQNY